MSTFTLTDLGNRSGEVVEAAFQGPVDITSRGKRKFVLLTASEFDRLKDKANTQRAYRTDTLSKEERSYFLEGLERIASENEDDK